MCLGVADGKLYEKADSRKKKKKRGGGCGVLVQGSG
jgi:hypothetical protein